MEKLIVLSREEFTEELLKTLRKFDEEKEKKRPPKLFTVNQVAKMFGKAHNTVKRMVANGVIHSTASGLIPEDAINEYLNRNV